uniref:Ion_trans_2 domain-containing protein n=1 Tax=Elaeophora elaphi TaxID=1147741 RepID=A0A0R3S4X5_9BILA
MCISNETAIQVAKALKQFYHKFGIGHIVLLVSYMNFLLFAAGIFMILETANVNLLRKHWLEALAEHRKSFVVHDMVPQIFNNTKLLVFIHDDKSRYLTKTLNELLMKYEDTLKIRQPLPILPCDYINSLIFICSTVTTIGHGNIYPTTESGRYFSMVCATIGIPFTLMVIKDLSYLIAILFRYPCACFVYFWHIFRYCTLQPVDENELIQRIHGINAARHSDYRNLSKLQTATDRSSAQYTDNDCRNGSNWLGNSWMHDNSFLFAAGTDFVYFISHIQFANYNRDWRYEAGSRAYWLPGRMYMPMTTKVSARITYETESFDSSTNLNFISDCPLNHYVTLGVLQSEDKCPLLRVMQKENAYIDVNTQTESGNREYVPQCTRTQSPEALLIDKPITSRDDVNDLIVETYGARPARLISSGAKLQKSES